MFPLNHLIIPSLVTDQIKRDSMARPSTEILLYTKTIALSRSPKVYLNCSSNRPLPRRSVIFTAYEISCCLKMQKTIGRHYPLIHRYFNHYRNWMHLHMSPHYILTSKSDTDNQCPRMNDFSVWLPHKHFQPSVGELPFTFPHLPKSVCRFFMETPVALTLLHTGTLETYSSPRIYPYSLMDELPPFKQHL